MSELENERSTTDIIPAPARAVPSAYIVLAGIWVLLSMLYCYLWLARGSGGASTAACIFGGISCGWIFWIMGFRLWISDNSLWYRDGFYRVTAVPFSKINRIRNDWITWEFLWKGVKVPRLIVDCSDGLPAVMINPKLFGRVGLNAVISYVEANSRGVCSSEDQSSRPN